jgi:hypothetical protein
VNSHFLTATGLGQITPPELRIVVVACASFCWLVPPNPSISARHAISRCTDRPRASSCMPGVWPGIPLHCVPQDSGPAEATVRGCGIVATIVCAVKTVGPSTQARRQFYFQQAEMAPTVLHVYSL